MVPASLQLRKMNRLKMVAIIGHPKKSFGSTNISKCKKQRKTSKQNKVNVKS